MALLDDVKLAIRITHNKLDSEIRANIAAARAEMVRLSIDEAVANDENNPLIVEAIKTYVKMEAAEDMKLREGFEKSWLFQLDNLRKSHIPAPEPLPEEGDGNV